MDTPVTQSQENRCTGHAEDASPRRLARTAGGLYLVNILLGAFAIGLVPALLIAPDAATTAHNIQTHELLYRLGIVAHLVVTITNIPMAVIFYDLFKVVNRRIALLEACFTLVATAVEVASLSNQFTPLVLLRGSYISALPTAQLQALIHLPGDLSSMDYDIFTVLYGLDILCAAYLVLKSTFLPKTIGALLVFDALTYLIYSFTDLLAPGSAAHLAPWNELGPVLGEGTFCIWLLAVGVDSELWTRKSRTGQ